MFLNKFEVWLCIQGSSRILSIIFPWWKWNTAVPCGSSGLEMLAKIYTHIESV